MKHTGQPKQDVARVTGPQDVARLYIILSGDRHFGRYCRLVALDEAVLPQAIPSGAKRVKARVEAVSHRPEDIEEALAMRRVGEGPTPEHPGSVHRPAGEGRYGIVEHDEHTDLVYVLELPRTQGPVQRDLGIQPKATYQIARWEAGAPKPIQDPSTLWQGTDLTLEPEAAEVSAQVEDQLNVQPESGATAEIFAELKLRRVEYPTEPLYTGEWL